MAKLSILAYSVVWRKHEDHPETLYRTHVGQVRH